MVENVHADETAEEALQGFTQGIYQSMDLSTIAALRQYGKIFPYLLKDTQPRKYSMALRQLISIMPLVRRQR